MKYIFTILILSFCQISFGQNLVPNPSFEDTVHCPNTGGQVANAANWYLAENTPDYFNACCSSSNSLGVPSNNWAYRNAATGYAYCGFILYENWDNYIEIIGVKLIDTLRKGKKYDVSFKLSSNSNHPLFFNGVCNKIGMLFSTIKCDLSNLPPNNNYCQFHTDSLIKDTIGWVEVHGNFIADSNYTYLSIGQFYTKQNIDTVSYWSIPNNYALRVYYFIDDVYVGYDSTQDHNGINEISEKDISVYPNPGNTKCTINFNGYSFQSIAIIDLYGRQLYFDNQLNTTKKEIDVSHFTNGSYIIQFNSSQTNFNKKINIIHY